MKKILIIAGEASGDLHGGNVVLELKKLRPDLELFGTGGKILKSAGVRLHYRDEDLAIIGFSEILKHYGFFKKVFAEMVALLDKEHPDAVLLVDYPGFNLKFAVEAKRRGIKVIYYIAPQVWAWKKNRIDKIKKYVDELIVLFPFEVGYFRREGMETRCFGHPLLDIVKPTLGKDDVIKKWNLDPGKRIVSILPGSRDNETNKHLPLLFQTLDLLIQDRNDLQFVFPLAPTIKKDIFDPFLDKTPADISVAENDTYNLVAHSDLALVASGTATLETSILKTPMIIFYSPSVITYLIGKYILRVKYIGLPNIMLDETVVPEDQLYTSPKKMVRNIRFYLDNPDEYQRVKKNLVKVKAELGDVGAYRKTAAYINTLI